eukprot:TRINITY_DN47998_c0_g1_i1.p1 TRINITY_DN47998_c0_g1~~TRINITY_DN47998_c0_g1_i1.p1  ORF type:complete len:123 (-),score=11.46 TRINITY_DN47998_c0_g1_i1:199-567(-)
MDSLRDLDLEAAAEAAVSSAFAAYEAEQVAQTRAPCQRLICDAYKPWPLNENRLAKKQRTPTLFSVSAHGCPRSTTNISELRVAVYHPHFSHVAVLQVDYLLWHVLPNTDFQPTSNRIKFPS